MAIEEFIKEYLVIGEPFESTFGGMRTRHVTMNGAYVTSLFDYDSAMDVLPNDSSVKFLYKHSITHAYSPKDFSPAFDGDVACVGFSDENQAYYGWSHRAWNEFKIGHVSTKNSFECHSGYIPGYLEEHPEKDFRIKPGFVCKTLDDCKMVAFAFSEAVS